MGDAEFPRGICAGLVSSAPLAMETGLLLTVPVVEATVALADGCEAVDALDQGGSRGLKVFS